MGQIEREIKSPCMYVCIREINKGKEKESSRKRKR